MIFAKSSPDPINRYIAEYFQRTRLKEMGYVFNGDSLDGKKARAFLFIDKVITEKQSAKKTVSHGRRKPDIRG